MNQIAQNTVDETVPVSTLEANTTETKTKSVKTHTGRQKQTFLGIQRVDRAKTFTPLSDTSDSVNIQLSPETLNL
jgi:hypothetical protein